MEKKPYSDARWWDDPKPEMAACGRCVHYITRGKCRAFPDEIPRELLLSVEVRHTLPYPGDGGYLFTPKVAAAQNAKEAVA
jgi:hypothetical protein